MQLIINAVIINAVIASCRLFAQLERVFLFTVMFFLLAEEKEKYSCLVLVGLGGPDNLLAWQDSVEQPPGLENEANAKVPKQKNCH